MHIQVLGPLRLVGELGEVRLPGPRPMAMLSMLVLAPQGAVARSTLIDRFWGDRPEAQAGASLRQTLYAVRQALGPDSGRIGGSTGWVSFDLDGVEVDLLAERDRTGPATAADRARLVALSRRDLLEGLSLSAPGVEDWLREMRGDWQKLIGARLRDASAAAFAEGDWDAARELAESLLALDPFCEGAMASLLRIDSARADRAGARRRFAAFASMLEAELGVPPSDDLAALMRTLESPAAPCRPAGPRGPAPGLRARLDWGRPGAGISGLDATARAVLIEELSRAGTRVFLAEAAPDSLPVPFLIRGEIVAFGAEQTVLLEVQDDEREVLFATRLGFRWPLDLAVFEAGMGERARAVAAALRSRRADESQRIAGLTGVVTGLAMLQDLPAPDLGGPPGGEEAGPVAPPAPHFDPAHLMPDLGFLSPAPRVPHRMAGEDAAAAVAPAVATPHDPLAVPEAGRPAEPVLSGMFHVSGAFTQGSVSLPYASVSLSAGWASLVLPGLAAAAHPLADLSVLPTGGLPSAPVEALGPGGMPPDLAGVQHSLVGPHGPNVVNLFPKGQDQGSERVHDHADASDSGLAVMSDREFGLLLRFPVEQVQALPELWDLSVPPLAEIGGWG